VSAVPAFNVPATILCGGGASREVGVQAKRLGISRALIVTDAFLVRQGVAGVVAQDLRDAGIEVATFDGVQPEPIDRNVIDGLAMLRAAGSQAVVAVGGGSPIDTAKAISMLATNPPPLARYQGLHRFTAPGLPVIAIPTTAGTGSEVTKVVVITDTERDVKMMMLDAHLLPRVALVDFELTLSMPGPLTAAVGVDTLTHGIEAYVSRKATAMTDPLALSCISLAARHLLVAFREPGNRVAREAMMLASCQGGMAFANSSVCLVHGMSRPIGALFHLPHGLSNAVLLPTVTRWSVRGAEERYATVARAMGLAAPDDSTDRAIGALIEGLERLNAELDIPRLGRCRGMDRARYDSSLAKMAADALASNSPQNNPRVPSADEIVELYQAAW
jgi:alcohol dehydrogenase class IV